MKVSIILAAAMFTALGFKSVENWDAARHNAKLAKLAKIINDPEQCDPSVIEDAAARKTFDEIAAALKKGDTVEIVEAAPAKTEKKAAPAKAEKPAKADKKPAPAAEDDSDDDADEEDAKPAKKSDKKAAPAKTEKKAAPAKKSEGKKDKYGFREGSAIALIAAALTAKPQSQKEIVEAAGLAKGTYYEALGKLVKSKIAERVEVDGGNAWKRVKKSAE